MNQKAVTQRIGLVLGIILVEELLDPITFPGRLSRIGELIKSSSSIEELQEAVNSMFKDDNVVARISFLKSGDNIKIYDLTILQKVDAYSIEGSVNPAVNDLYSKLVGMGINVRTAGGSQNTLRVRPKADEILKAFEIYESMDLTLVATGKFLKKNKVDDSVN